MIEGLLVPPNVRNNKGYSDAELEKTRHWLDEEIGNFENVVFMGVPGSEKDNFIERGAEILESSLLEDAKVYAHNSVGKGLEGFDYESISYEEMGSRIADVEWMKKEFDGEESVAVVSYDYNVRTGKEIDKRMDDHFSFGQFAPEFQDFQNFDTRNYLRGLLPWFESFEDETLDDGRSFDYEMPEIDGSPVLVLNVEYSDDMGDYREKMRSEALRDGLAELPYGQRMKDLGKSGLDWILNSFEY